MAVLALQQGDHRFQSLSDDPVPHQRLECQLLCGFPRDKSDTLLSKDHCSSGVCAGDHGEFQFAGGTRFQLIGECWIGSHFGH